MRKPPTSGRALYVANDSFTANVDGDDCSFLKGVTLVREGHPALIKYPQLFDVARAHYEVDVEAATAAPGEVRA